MRTNRSEYNAHAAMRQGAAVPVRKVAAPRRGLRLITVLRALAVIAAAVVAWGAL